MHVSDLIVIVAAMFAYTVGGFFTFRRLIRWALKVRSRKNSKSLHQPPSSSLSPTLSRFLYGNPPLDPKPSLEPYLLQYQGKLSMSASGFPSKPTAGDHYVDLVAGDVYVFSGELPIWSLKYKAGTPQAAIWVEAARGAALALGLDETGRPIEPRKVTEPVVGFRVWELEVHGRSSPRLRSLNSEYGVWEAGVNKAECKQHWPHDGSHVAPAHGCHCGFWFKNSIPSTQAHMKQGRILGAVQGWGRVIKHEDGGRAENASVVALCKPVEDVYASLAVGTAMLPSEVAEKLAVVYDVPLLSPPEFVRQFHKREAKLP